MTLATSTLELRRPRTLDEALRMLRDEGGRTLGLGAMAPLREAVPGDGPPPRDELLIKTLADYKITGKVEEKDWLTGDHLGWKGPWGTTYPANLRIALNRAYSAAEPRSWWVLRLESVVYVLIGAVALLAFSFLVVLAPLPAVESVSTTA